LLFLARCIVGVFCHAGINYPLPRGDECTAASPLGDCAGLAGEDGCGNTPKNPQAVPTANFTLIVYQRVGHPPFDPKADPNTYTIGYGTPPNFKPLMLWLQTNSTDGIFIDFPISLPSGTTTTTIQMIFNATNGGSISYYSCADVYVGNPMTTGSSSNSSNKQIKLNIVNLVIYIVVVLLTAFGST